MTNIAAEDSKQAPAPILLLRNVSVNFGGVKALQDVSFEVLPGEVQCIAGENGSGKSTLLHLIAGLETPTNGTVSVGGVALETMGPLGTAGA